MTRDYLASSLKTASSIPNVHLKLQVIGLYKFCPLLGDYGCCLQISYDYLHWRSYIHTPAY